MTWPQTEVLVHISAPSKASDDAKYRCLTQAYLDFEPARRLDITIPPQQRSSSSGCRQPESESKAVQPIDLSDLSFQSVWGNVSPLDAVQAADPKPTLGLQSQSRPASPSWGQRPKPRQTCYVSPTVVIPDSQPAVVKRRSTLRPSLDESFDSPYRIFISDSQGSTASGSAISFTEALSPDLSVLPKAPNKRKASPSQPSPHRSTIAERAATAQPGAQWKYETVEAQDEMQSPGWESVHLSSAADLHNLLDELPSSLVDNIPSSLPDECGQVILQTKHFNDTKSTATPGLQRGVSEPVKTKQRRLHDEMGSSPPPITRGASDAGPWPKRPKLGRKAAGSSPPVVLAGAAEAHRGRTDEGAAVGAAQDASARKGMQHMLLIPSSLPGTESFRTSLRILSPEPPVSCAYLDEAAFITTKLEELASCLDLGKRYRPLESASRTLRPFERGFWNLSTSSWPVALRHRAWAFLAKCVGRGDAGWSVWCSRNEQPHTWLRLHCFGAAAGHTYLLLYLASQQHIRDTGAVWLDASGTPAITVSPRRQRVTASEYAATRGS